MVTKRGGQEKLRQRIHGYDVTDQRGILQIPGTEASERGCKQLCIHKSDNLEEEISSVKDTACRKLTQKNR